MAPRTGRTSNDEAWAQPRAASEVHAPGQVPRLSRRTFVTQAGVAVVGTVLLFEAFPAPAEAAPALKFPWDKAENPWTVTQGPHDWIAGTKSGLDFDKDRTPRRILSMFDGDVTLAGTTGSFWCGALGRNTQNTEIRVKALDGSGWDIWYLHPSRIDVRPGQRVSQGQILGLTGAVGCATAVHVHVELVVNGVHTSWVGKTIDGWTVPTTTSRPTVNSTNAPSTSSPSGKPAAPSNVSVTNPTTNSLRVNFKDNATNESRIDVERKTNGGAWSGIGSFNALTGTGSWYFTNTGLNPNTTYTYRMRAYATNGGYSDYSNEASGTTTGSTPAPGPGPTPPRSEVIADDRSGGFSKGGQYWWEAGIGYSGHMWWTYVNGNSVSSWGEWRANLGGNYQVYVFVPRDNATTRNARYEIYHNGGTATRAVNQNNYFDAWVDVGTYGFSSGDGRRVRLTDATGEAGSSGLKVGFDAVRFVPR